MNSVTKSLLQAILFLLLTSACAFGVYKWWAWAMTATFANITVGGIAMGLFGGMLMVFGCVFVVAFTAMTIASGADLFDALRRGRW